MEETQIAALKERVNAIYRQSMQDVVRLEAAAIAGAKGGSSSSMARAVAIVQVDISWLRCPVCSLLLSPPVFQCKSGHLACRGCRARMCRECEGGGGTFDARNKVVEDIISVSKFKCPHTGCQDFFAFPDLMAHREACHHAPCFCGEPGCTFAAPPLSLFIHLSIDHLWPADRFEYGKVIELHAPLSELHHLLLADEDHCMFVLVVGALGPDTAVSVVCIRKVDGPSQPCYTVDLLVSSPPLPGAAEGSTIVTSSDRPSEVAVDKLPWVLTVPSTYLAGADGASKVVSLKIQIKKIP